MVRQYDSACSRSNPQGLLRKVRCSAKLHHHLVSKALLSKAFVFPATPAAPDHRLRPMARSDGHKGNKQSLPARPCSVCGRPMSWRKKWEKNWEQVKYCSDACRRAKGGA